MEDAEHTRSEKPVETGSFGIDRSRALEKLARFQLHDPLNAVLLIARAAVDSEASGLDCERRGDAGLLLRWRGKGFSGDFLAAPFDALFEYEGADGRRRRQFATALLALTRMPGTTVAVESGSDRLEADERGERLSASAEPVGGVTVSIGFTNARACGAAIDRLISKTALLPFPLRVNGKTRHPEHSELRRFRHDGYAGDYAVDRLRPGGAVDLYKQGVFVERVSVEGGGWLHARLEVPDLELDLSQGGAVRNDAFERATRAVAELLRLRFPKGVDLVGPGVKDKTKLIGTAVGLFLGMGLLTTAVVTILNHGLDLRHQIAAGLVYFLGLGGGPALWIYFTRDKTS